MEMTETELYTKGIPKMAYSTPLSSETEILRWLVFREWLFPFAGPCRTRTSRLRDSIAIWNAWDLPTPMKVSTSSFQKVGGGVVAVVLDK